MPTARQIYIAVVGTGGVGKAFLTQLEALSKRNLSNSSSSHQISLVFLGRSSKCVIGSPQNPISFGSWQADLDASTRAPLKPSSLADFLSDISGDTVLVDNTSNADLAATYPLFLSRGTSVITPNKKAFSSDLASWDAIFSSAANGSGSSTAGLVFHESTVGAGLPVISTLKDLVDTGDKITRIEGVFSGTMSFLFNNFMPVGGGGGKFSAEVKNAKDLGYTEPDPRDDLNGLDVARKLTILARLAGLKVASPTSFPVQSLIPTELESCTSGEDFMTRLPEFDDRIEAVKEEAAKEGKVLRFVGSIDVQKGAVEVGLKKFDASHPIAALKGSDNIISFTSEKYPSPLIIQGAGAGADVTAMGVTADLIKVCNMLR